jgi:hypothetical protein
MKIGREQSNEGFRLDTQRWKRGQLMDGIGPNG